MKNSFVKMFLRTLPKRSLWDKIYCWLFSEKEFLKYKALEELYRTFPPCWNIGKSEYVREATAVGTYDCRCPSCFTSSSKRQELAKFFYPDIEIDKALHATMITLIEVIDNAKK